jgi:RNA-dependent RNA polymerase
MALEDRGVDKETFLDLQEKAKALIYHSKDSLENFSKLLTKYNLGGSFHLEFILEQLSKLGLDFKDGTDKKAIEGAFFERLVRYSMNHSLREVKFKARIPVPDSYQLVGVADEGQAYIEEGIASEDDVYTLEPGKIYGAFLRVHNRTTSRRLQHPLAVCIQNSTHEQPIYLKGTCVISRSPVIHPGDGTYMSMTLPIQAALISLAVQRVYAVGKPPEDKICFFRGLKNVVVLPAVGAYLRVSGVPSSTYPPSRRAFAGIVPRRRRFGRVRICITEGHKCSQLCSDTYDIYHANQGLIPQVHTAAADENKSDPWTLDENRGDATVEDICDFIVKYINSDVMVCLRPVLGVSSSSLSCDSQGLLADRHIIIADQSKVGTGLPITCRILTHR